ncbi:YdiU family protein [filamentous cyanobacterium CCT1]|nr:YdiU family protein [filamentous cyanobacterium CCT1]PSN76693.1 YdiU family protein [filamentous cyanobacterium CCP4]
MTAANPLLALDYLPALESLGDDYYDIVPAAEFPQHILRFRNDDLVRLLGLDPAAVSDDDFIEAFGKFQGREPFLALRYHGYQFGEYNPFLGDGRGFLYGQVRGTDGNLYDFGTKGSGTTPYSRGGDGRLTLKGGVREVLASEALHALGVNSSRAFSLVETGEALWRGDEPSPTRSAVLVRFSQSHIRFGTFERLEYHNRPDLIAKLLEHVIDVYYPEARLFTDTQERYLHFYGELCDRVARLAAQWMAVGFCHAVLNTDNMSITGESFDYGPYAFMDDYDPRFTAAYFDYAGRYSYGNQPLICQMNLKALQKPLKLIMPEADLEAALAPFKARYEAYYQQLMLRKLGFESLTDDLATTLVSQTIALLSAVTVGYHDFFLALSQQFSPAWREHATLIFSTTLQASDAAAASQLDDWRQTYYRCLQSLDAEKMEDVASLLKRTNPETVLLRPAIEAVWEPITTDDNWQPFYDLLDKVQHPFREN